MKHASFKEEETHQSSSNKYESTEADKLQTRTAERQLGCLLVMKTKGDTQLQVCRWLTAANSWEAWRQLNLQCIRKRSLHFKLLAKIMNISFDSPPASCLQEFEAWKEHVVRYQELSGEQLPDSTKLSAVVNGLSSSVRHFVLLHLDSGCSFEDLDNLLAVYSSMHERQVFSLIVPWDKSSKKKHVKGKAKSQTLTSSTSLEKEATKVNRKEKGKRNLPSLQTMKARERLISFQKENNGAVFAGRKGTEPKLAGGTTSSINSNNYNIELGSIQTSSSIRPQKLPK